MKAADIRKMEIHEIESKLEEAREELMNLRFQQVTGQLTDTNRMRFLRRDIARLLTVLNERLRETAE